MATRITDYAESITEQSRLELLGIARWLADNKKTAYLVGGWAVYYYTKPGERPSAKWGEAKWNKFKWDDPNGFKAVGSKDIDLVFQNKKEKEKFEQEYCRNNGYSKRGPVQPKEWVKRVNDADIIFDPDVLSKTWRVRGARVGWNHLTTYSVRLELDAGTSIMAPSKELLLLYKCVALIERTDARGKPNAEIARLDSKIWKDANDILALHDTGISAGALASLAEKTGLARILNYAKQIISVDYDEYGFTQYAFAKKFLELKP